MKLTIHCVSDPDSDSNPDPGEQKWPIHNNDEETEEEKIFFSGLFKGTVAWDSLWPLYDCIVYNPKEGMGKTSSRATIPLMCRYLWRHWLPPALWWTWWLCIVCWCPANSKRYHHNLKINGDSKIVLDDLIGLQRRYVRKTLTYQMSKS